ncbi:hypothetical protein SBA1_1790006 [Candidatus Sulfotelmatobacter kueseliae]|uniref:Uncharacterized protein n=1 Tax=Candidatus Sulfotelmatobacter kueseliae TaxID=2042962 RepID=A0A2U3KCI4_9BACT|nr:hypothetical protein SBA1_1790006 [Candidatus Sulfotelmatobacter kueseliae]
MTSLRRPAIQSDYPSRRDLRWSRSEKAIARKAFDTALTQELQEVIQQAKQMAGKIQQPSDLWDLEDYLTQRRKEINRKYEYRSSPHARLREALARRPGR